MTGNSNFSGTGEGPRMYMGYGRIISEEEILGIIQESARRLEGKIHLGKRGQNYEVIEMQKNKDEVYSIKQ